jgi:hypothetical protein
MAIQLSMIVVITSWAPTVAFKMPDPVLALTADVEQAATKREGDGDSGQHERRHEDERLLEIVGRGLARLPGDPGEEPVQPGPLEDGAIRRHRVVPRDEDDEAADQEGEDGRGERHEDAADAGREPGCHLRRGVAG